MFFLLVKRKILNSFFLSRKAKSRIDEIKSDNKDIFIRVMIVKGGCAGYQYYILMDDYVGENDLILMKKNIHYNEELIYVVTDKESFKFIKNGKLDFNDSFEFSGFTIKNPNAKRTCNCGNSFNCIGEKKTKQKRKKRTSSKP